jgi:hypothetical protein
MKGKSDTAQFYDFPIFKLYGIEGSSHIIWFYNNKVTDNYITTFQVMLMDFYTALLITTTD